VKIHLIEDLLFFDSTSRARSIFRRLELPGAAIALPFFGHHWRNVPVRPRFVFFVERRFFVVAFHLSAL
jgi:hypothetical protein